MSASSEEEEPIRFRISRSGVVSEIEDRQINPNNPEVDDDSNDETEEIDYPDEPDEEEPDEDLPSTTNLPSIGVLPRNPPMPFGYYGRHRAFNDLFGSVGRYSYAADIPCPMEVDSELDAEPVLLACIICKSHQITTVNFPCMHSCMCITCSNIMVKRPNVKCPVCRSGIIQIAKIYLSSVNADINPKKRKASLSSSSSPNKVAKILPVEHESKE